MSIDRYEKLLMSKVVLLVTAEMLLPTHRSGIGSCSYILLQPYLVLQIAYNAITVRICCVTSVHLLCNY